MSSSSKKVILRTVENILHFGYLPLSGFVVDDAIALLGLDARIAPIPLAAVRSIAYVRDFNLNDKDDPERLARRTFMARPRAEGLWLRLTLRGGDILEGLAPLDLALADGLLDDRGFFLTPPGHALQHPASLHSTFPPSWSCSYSQLSPRPRSRSPRCRERPLRRRTTGSSLVNPRDVGAAETFPLPLVPALQSPL